MSSKHFLAINSKHPFLLPYYSALSREEFLNSMMGMGFTRKFSKEIFRRADGDKNGEIDHLEFLNAMLMFIADFDDINEAVGSDDGDDDSSDDNGEGGGGGGSGGKGDIVAPVVDPVVEPARPPTPPAVVRLHFLKHLFSPSLSAFLGIFLNMKCYILPD